MFGNCRGAQAVTGVLPSAMFTIVISSLTTTSPMPLPPPTQVDGGAGDSMAIPDGRNQPPAAGTGDASLGQLTRIIHEFAENAIG